MSNIKNVDAYSRSQIKRGTVLSYLALGLNIISGLLFTPWLIHQIGKSDYGIYSIGTSIIALLIMDFGISDAVAKYVAQYQAEGNEDKINDLLSLVSRIYIILALFFLIIFFLLYFFLNHIYLSLSSSELIKLKMVYIIVASYNVFAFIFTPLSGIMLAYEHIVSLKLCDIIYRILVIAVSVIAILLGQGLLAAVFANVIAGIVVILYKIAIIRKYHQIKLNPQYKNPQLLKNILSFSVWIAVLVLTQRCIYSITPSILGAVSGSSEVTLFSLASTLEGYAYSFGSVIATLFLAKITRQLFSDDIIGFTKLTINIGKLQFVLISMILVGFLSDGRNFVELWMGTGYVSIYYMTLLLLFPSVLLWPFMTVSTGLTVKSVVREQALVNLAAAVINVLLELLLVRKYGAVGAAISISLANTFKAMALIFVYQHFLPIRIKDFLFEIFIKYTGAAILATILSRFFISLINIDNLKIAFLLNGFVALATYLLLVFLTVILFDNAYLKEIYTIRR
ncbi:oligosaccharide flippase family protein [Oribacterium sinus]|uniref:oligosaccharide flippase family protein n=1 Tax=Oribacterium sinus TaxID=237576 RepID=UPI0028D60FA5|nr:oligosaccharide flippase family protein [Oribacterium sinus]